jgi:ADP-heptose:LPS heptosyltransferase
MSRKKHLLVIRLSAMGDVAMIVPVISALVHQYPNVRVTVLTRAFFKPLFSQLPNVSVYEADVKGKHKGIFGLWRLYKALRTLQIDAVADLHNVLRSNILKTYFRFGEFQFEQIDKGRGEKKALIRGNDKVFKPLKSTHQRYADVFESLGYTLNLSLNVVLPKRDRSDETDPLFTSSKRKLLGIAPFAAFEGKMYPLDLMEQVVSELSELNTFQILLFGGGKKEQLALENLENKYPNSTCIAGKVSFSEELAIISNVDLMLAMDSGNAHLAALFGVPTITLWGVTHPYAGFYPFGQELENALLADRDRFPLIPTSVYGNKMPVGYAKAMRTIHPQDIIEKIKNILKEPSVTN